MTVTVILPDGEEVEPVIKRIAAPEYKQCYVTGAFGGVFSIYDLRIFFYKEDLIQGDDKPVLEREVQTSVVMSLASAKQLSNWLDELILNWEKEHGEIYIGEQESENE